MCKSAGSHKWTEYWWNKPGEKTPSRKIAYMIKVPGKKMWVGVGMYDKTTAIADLNKITAK